MYKIITLSNIIGRYVKNAQNNKLTGSEILLRYWPVITLSLLCSQLLH